LPSITTRPVIRHPPSAADVALTVEIVAAGQQLDIELLDHLIIGQGRWPSLKRLGLGFPKG
jgi:DNA repair protein RadC